MMKRLGPVSPGYRPVTDDGKPGTSMTDDTSDEGAIRGDATEAHPEPGATPPLSTSEARLRAAMRTSGIGVFDIRLPQHSGYFSDEYLQIYGYGPEHRERFERGWFPLVYPEDVPALRAMQASRTPVTQKHNIHEYRRLHRDGHYLWLRWVGEIVERDATGQPTRIIGTLQNVDQRRRAEDALRAITAELERAQAVAQLGNWAVAYDGHPQYWSEELFRFFGLDPAQGIPTQEGMERLFTPASWEHRNNSMGRALWDGQPYEIEHEVRRADGRTAWGLSRAHARRDAEGRIVGLYGTLQDITERKRNELALREASERVRALSSHLEDEINLERKRIAGDVHDQLGQMLTAIKIELQVLRAQHEGLDTVSQGVGRLLEKVEATIEITRNVALNLRPSVLDLGLVPALEWLAEDFSLRTEVGCTVRPPAGEVRLSDKAANELFRIVQESLTNVTRHAQASRVRISLEANATRLLLLVDDDGCGFDPAQARSKGHFGLLGMQERALRLGAELSIESQPGTGTRLRLSMPLENPPQGEAV